MSAMFSKISLPSARAEFDPSPTLRINEMVLSLKKEGKDIISFGAGAPKLLPSEKVRSAVGEVDLGELYAYGATKGDEYLHESIRGWNTALGFSALDRRDIQVTAGAKEAVFVTMLTLCDAGDSVAIVRPYWPSYVNIAKSLDLKIVFLDEEIFLRGGARLEQCLDAIGDRIKALIFSSPSNPTGAAIDLDVLENIAWKSANLGFWVISDEIYQTLYYPAGRDRAPSILDVSPDFSNQCIQIN